MTQNMDLVYNLHFWLPTDYLFCYYNQSWSFKDVYESRYELFWPLCVFRVLANDIRRQYNTFVIILSLTWWSSQPVLPNCSVSKLAFAAGAFLATVRPTVAPQTHIWGLGPRSCWRSLFTHHLHSASCSTTERLRRITGPHFILFLFLGGVCCCLRCLSKHWFEVISGRCMSFCFMPYAALFMFSFYPAIHHSSVPWFKLWATLTKLMHWSELGQVWNMNWLHVWVCLRVWCFFSLRHTSCSIFLLYLPLVSVSCLVSMLLHHLNWTSAFISCFC